MVHPEAERFIGDHREKCFPLVQSPWITHFGRINAVKGMKGSRLRVKIHE